MNDPFVIPRIPLVVYTDLDGSLLDHDTYRFDAAVPALERLRELNVPVIPVTSKTLCEVEHIMRSELRIRTPVIAENGGVVAFPTGYLPEIESFECADNYVVRETVPDYTFITRTLAEIRQKFGFIFYGFKDMCESQVSELTGLTPEQSARAKWRRCSEPLLWRDTNTRLLEFRKILLEQGLSLTQGGRFLHVTGNYDKGTALHTVNEIFNKFQFKGYTTIALGDSPNDLAMLQKADIAVAIRRTDGGHLMPTTGKLQHITQRAGPAGWNDFMMSYLDEIVTATTQAKVAHG